MALTRSMVERWRELNGNWLYHAPLSQAIPWIKRDGLLPRGETGIRPNHGTLPSRSGCVYLMTESFAADPGLAGVGMASIRVRVDVLDESLFEADEDAITVHGDRHDAVEHLPGYAGLLWPEEGDDAADWMRRNNDVVGAPEWVLFSLQHGRVAYSGSIPTSALEIDPDVDAEWEIAGPGVPFRPVRWVGGQTPYQRRREQ